MKSHLVVRGARQHNLQGIDLELPRRAITVITGPSGSGKSSLAFDTIYAEGQRRYVESLSAYARQFLERMEKPAVDFIDGLSPAVAIEQKNPTRTSRSTVGTATEIYDFLRLMWARIGRTHCGVCGREMTPDSVSTATDALLASPSGTRFSIAFPLRRSAEATHAQIVDGLRAQGFIRVVADGVTRHLDELSEADDLAAVRDLAIVVDRLAVPGSPDAAVSRRIADALTTAFAEGDGECTALFADGAGPARRFTTRFECPEGHGAAPTPSPQLFSFNNPRGACPTCNGFGATLEYDEALIVPHPERSLSEGALDPWTKPRYDNKRRALADFAKRSGIPSDVPWRELPPAQRDQLFNARSRGFKGILPFFADLAPKKYKQYIRIFLRQYQTARTCPACSGARLRPEALNVRVDGRTIAAVSALPVREMAEWIDRLALSAFDAQVAAHILREARARTRFLVDVGLGYLSLDRATRTLSGGEAQRIALANSLGAHLVDALYVLDEPRIGLHPRDVGRLLSLLARLRDEGNTVIVVEHDLEAIRSADHMVELGPASGEHGGKVMFNGPIARAGESPLTGKYLTGQARIPLPEPRPTRPRAWITLEGAREHNLRDVTVRIPLNALTVVTGVSGSGKSTLVHDVLFRALETRLQGDTSAKQHLGEIIGAFEGITGWETLEDVVLVDQSPIGKSPRSNPVTYVKAWDEIRRIFAAQPLARQKRYTAGTFSFNVRGGRCEACEGAGQIQIEMVFMADVFVPCDECGGKRFKPGVLEVTVQGKNIHDVLQMTVDEAIRFFPREEKLGQALWQLTQVGLGYLRLGQPAPTLSGGESQRLKIARELAFAGRTRGRKLYILDEPTTGLHLDDIKKLARVFERLIDSGNTLVVIEHNLDVIKLADWIIDLGPDAGDDGGRLVAMGPPTEIARTKGSHTGEWLRPLLDVRPLSAAPIPRVAESRVS